MSAIEIVNKLLTSNAEVKALAKDAFPIEAPQEQKRPYFVTNISGGADELLLSGDGQYYRHRISVEAVADTGSKAIDMGNAALAALSGTVKQQVSVGRKRYVDVDITFANVDQTMSSPNRDVFVRLLQFNVRWREAA